MKTLIKLLLILALPIYLQSCASSESGESDDAADEASEDGGSESGSEFSEFDDEGSGGESESSAENEEGFDEGVDQDEDEQIEADLDEDEAPIAKEKKESFSDLEESKPVETTTAAAEGEAVTITNIDYISNTAGGILQISTTGKSAFTTRHNADTNQFVIEVKDAKLPDALKRPFIMKEFESSFGAVNAYQNAGSTTARIVVQMRSAGEPVLQAEGNKLIVLPAAGAPVVAEVKKEAWEKAYDTTAATEDEKILGARTLDEFLSGSVKFYGTPISIETNDADIRDVIKFISEEKGVNLVLAEEVQGKVTLKLRDVPWDQALVIVMRTKGLGYIRQGSVLRITKLENLQAEAKAAKDIVDAQSRLTPLRVKVVPISYANPPDLLTQVTPFLTEGRGKIVADERTSSLVITDTTEVLERVQRLIKELDIPPAQVMIEGKIVEATESFQKSLGINWSFGDTTEISSSGGKDGSPVLLGINGSSSGGIKDATANLGINFGTIDVLGQLQATLGLAETEQIARIISSPRIVTMNRVAAEISQKGQVISYKSQSVAAAGDENVVAREATFRDVVLSLKVTPQITAEGSVIMDMQVKREFPGPDAGNGDRPINTREAKTKVLVANGQTAVVGGIYQSDETESETGVPGLKNIPVFGWLFKGKNADRTKNELLVFLTPRILNAKDQGVVE